MKHTITCLAVRPFRKNTLVGFASIRIDQMRLVIHDVALHEKGESRWAQLPAKPQLRDGAAVVDAHGKAQYAVVLELEDRETRDAFARAVWAAVLARYPKFAEAACAETAPC
jgi:hypothetical protein